MSYEIDVSIIIVNYNTYDLVIQCIESVYKNTNSISYEIIVVDNNSPNRDIENLIKVFPNVKLILNDENSGFGIANNIGAQNAGGKYLLLLNSDTIVLDNSISTLFSFMEEKQPIVGACGGNLCDANLQPASSFSRLMPSLLLDLDTLCFNFFSKILFGSDINYAYSNEPLLIKGNICGADLMISTKVFNELGGFDEMYFMYYEETDLLYRLRNLGYETYIVPQSKIIHLEGASEVLKTNKLDWTFASKRKYYLKNKSKTALIVSNYILNIIILQRVFIFKILGKKEKYKYWVDFYNWFKFSKIN